MASKTEICNLALRRLGNYRISAITEASPEARHCLQFFDNVRRTLLREFDFNFSETETTLSQLDGVSGFDFDYAYALPADYIRALKFEGVLAGTKQSSWRIASNRLYTDQSDSSEAVLEYIRDVEDCTEWDEMFVTAFSWYLAAAVAAPITKDPRMAGTLLEAGNAFLKDAKGADRVETVLQIRRGTQYSKYQAAREGWYGASAGGNWGAPWMYQDFGPPGNA